jgi:hypothetical protein
MAAGKAMFWILGIAMKFLIKPWHKAIFVEAKTIIDRRITQ